MEEGGERRVKVWDLPTRLFHWLLVVLLGVSWYTGKSGGIDEMTWHLWSGYAILALLIFRLVWGGIGSTTARFTHFVAGPGEGLRYAGALLRRAPPHYFGHTPLGGWMIVALLVVLLVQVVTGLCANDDIMTEGPLAGLVGKPWSDWMTTIHKWNFDLLLVLAGLHVLAVLAYLVVLGENLIGAMFTGRKRLPAGRPAPALRFASAWSALVVLAIAAALVYALLRAVR